LFVTILGYPQEDHVTEFSRLSCQDSSGG